ncbi:Hypothetical protein PHPALM_2233 [Phytophthora palmivora]|uniref:DUF7869 domain-containing protein n=1 Tax=Phytophthora palmivora TaxID=4796 RepID=A0A2P4YQA9_9STRA|nr:Hypothetical protein PHPALM_2233 [Phytophthora palmivora]
MSPHQPSPTLPAFAESSAPETRSTPSLTPSPSAPSTGRRCSSQEADVQLAQNTAGADAVVNDASSDEEESYELDSEEPDDSDDDGSAGEEDVTGESAESETDVEEEGISINLLDVDIQQCVTNLICDDVCERRCLQGKAGELECQTQPRDVVAMPLTIQRYKKRLRNGNSAAKVHSNRLNKIASKINLVWLVKWFKYFAAEVGEVVPVRVRIQKTKDGMVKKYYIREDYTLLPAIFTWEAPYAEMRKFVSLGLRVCEPARSTFRKLLSVHCSNIKIRAAQANVGDLCTIYQSRLRRGTPAEQVEELGQHTESAHRMRREYKKDKAAVHASDGSSSDVAVIVMDISQNLTVPSVTTTPSQWHFCSLLAVNVFGFFYENAGAQTNYHFIRTVLLPANKKHLIVYADNCSGQNKNNHVIKFFLAQVQMGVFERIDYKFFVKGRTKNSCDRGFGNIRRHVCRSDCWTMDHIISAVNEAATSSIAVHISRGNEFFKSYKPLVTELYKKLVWVQQYQIFSMDATKPGVVQCKKGPDDEPVEQDLRRKVDGVLTESTKVERMLINFLEDLSPPSLKAEKKTELYSKIRPYEY